MSVNRPSGLASTPFVNKKKRLTTAAASLKIQGLTLVELMIAMCLSILIGGIILSLFLTVKQNYRYQQGLMLIQENMQSASLLLGQWIRSSGNYGCNRLEQDTVFKNLSGINLKDLGLSTRQPASQVTLQALKNNPYFSAEMLARLKPDSDILWVRTTEQGYSLKNGMIDNVSQIKVLGNPHFKPDEFIVISDCEQVVLGKISKIRLWEKESVAEISLVENKDANGSLYGFSAGAQVASLSSILIYVGDTLRKNQNQQPIYALYTTDLNGRTLEWIEGVESMKLKFCCVGEHQTILPASEWPIEQKIQTVELQLLFSSIEEIMDKPTRYVFNNETVMPLDKQYRKPWMYIWTIRAAV